MRITHGISFTGEFGVSDERAGLRGAKKITPHFVDLENTIFLRSALQPCGPPCCAAVGCTDTHNGQSAAGERVHGTALRCKPGRFRGPSRPTLEMDMRTVSCCIAL